MAILSCGTVLLLFARSGTGIAYARFSLVARFRVGGLLVCRGALAFKCFLVGGVELGKKQLGCLSFVAYF